MVHWWEPVGNATLALSLLSSQLPSLVFHPKLLTDGISSCCGKPSDMECQQQDSRSATFCRVYSTHWGLIAPSWCWCWPWLCCCHFFEPHGLPLILLPFSDSQGADQQVWCLGYMRCSHPAAGTPTLYKWWPERSFPLMSGKVKQPWWVGKPLLPWTLHSLPTRLATQEIPLCL